MIFKRLLNNLLTSNHDFNANEKLLKHRFVFINSILMSGVLLAFIGTLYRLGNDAIILAEVDLLVSIFFSALILFLRRDKTYYDLTATAMIVFSFCIFISLSLLHGINQSKMIWFALFLGATFMIKDTKFGIYTAFVTIATLHFIHFTSFFDLKLADHELAMSTAAYIGVTILSIYTSRLQNSSLHSLQKSNKTIHKQQLELYNQLRTSALTKLPNQFALEEYLNNTHEEVSLVILDIDAFDTISSEFGKPFSDQVIAQTHQIFENFETGQTLLFHIFNGRFAFVFSQFKNNQDIQLAQSMKALFENLHITYKKVDLSLTFSIGIARGLPDKLIIQATNALSYTKAHGKNGYTLFKHSAIYEEEQRNNIYWAKRIKEIILENNLIVYYQPIVDNHTCKIDKYECLVRAIDNGKVIPPHFFLEVAKSRGYLKNITKIIIDKSFKVFEHNNFDFSINLTEEDLKDNDIVHFLRYKLKQYNMNPNRIFLEILESVTSLQTTETEEILKEFKEMGFKIAIDDFGTETSNFTRILNLDVDVIKIDGSFVKNLDTNPNSRKIVETIVLFANKVNAQTIAEFVHNETIYDIAKEIGVDYSQGYYFSAPLPQVDEISREEAHPLNV
ncbi:MAG: GGDEF domain-containing protein [Epsilonproteobacteria bacterium]|nr:GGDEF domain-containing protein [Campylobacterota bacterium]